MNRFSFIDAQLSPLAHTHAMPLDGELHVWFWTTASVDEDALQFLGQDELERYERFATPELQQRFLASHAGQRQILAGYLDTVPSELEFEQTSAGKPHLAGAALRFNLSHSADANLLAVATVDVGVDIERIRGVTSLLSLAARHFARPELEAWRNSDDPQREFFATWTRKEAVIKLVGLGLAAGVQGLDTSTISEEITIPTAWEYPANQCWLADLAIDSQNVAAVAIGNKPPGVRLFRAE